MTKRYIRNKIKMNLIPIENNGRNNIDPKELISEIQTEHTYT